jgi:hypothetical protein
MRSRRVAIAAVLVLAACGSDPTTTETTGTADATVVPVRARGSIDGGRFCPAGQPPCWTIDGGAEAADGFVDVEGEWRRSDDGESIRLTGMPVAVDDDVTFPNPCPDAVPMGGENGDEAAVGRAQAYAATIPDEYASAWLARPGPVFVVAVTRDAERHQAALGEPSVCFTDDGFRFTEAELTQVQEELGQRADEWAENGWVAQSWGVEGPANHVTIEFETIDARLRDEIEERWGDRVAVEAWVEVLEGTVDALDAPAVGDDEIPISTGSRGGAHMDALGRFTLGYDADLDCVYLDAGGERIMPVWQHGARALRDPVRVVDGNGEVIVEVGAAFETGGGNTPLPEDGEDRLACGADSAWVM